MNVGDSSDSNVKYIYRTNKYTVSVFKEFVWHVFVTAYKKMGGFGERF